MAGAGAVAVAGLRGLVAAGGTEGTLESLLVYLTDGSLRVRGAPLCWWLATVSSRIIASCARGLPSLCPARAFCSPRWIATGSDETKLSCVGMPLDARIG